MTRYRKITVTAGVGIVAFGVCVLLFSKMIKNVTRDAYASEWVACDIIEYMKINNGKWPKSWVDLRAIHERFVAEGMCPWSFEMLAQRVIVDWSADPAYLATMPESIHGPPFQVVTLRNGESAYWQNKEPNQLIHEWLKENMAEINQTTHRP